MPTIFKVKHIVILQSIFLLATTYLLVLRHTEDMATATATQQEVRKGLSRLGIGGRSSKNLPDHAYDPTQPGNPDTKRTDQLFAEEVGRTNMLWSPFLNRGTCKP